MFKLVAILNKWYNSLFGDWTTNQAIEVFDLIIEAGRPIHVRNDLSLIGHTGIIDDTIYCEPAIFVAVVEALSDRT